MEKENGRFSLSCSLALALLLASLPALQPALATHQLRLELLAEAGEPLPEGLHRRGAPRLFLLGPVGQDGLDLLEPLLVLVDLGGELVAGGLHRDLVGLGDALLRGGGGGGAAVGGGRRLLRVGGGDAIRCLLGDGGRGGLGDVLDGFGGHLFSVVWGEGGGLACARFPG